MISDSVIFATIGTLSGVLLGALLTGIFNVWSKNIEYKNTYLKMILEKRLDAYEFANSLIVQLKYPVQDPDGKAYHTIFLNDQKFDNFLSRIYLLPEKSLWMNDETSIKIKKIFDLLVSYKVRNGKGESLIDIGKEIYLTLGIRRDELEKSLLSDLKTLYKIDNFLSNKSVVTTYENRNVNG
jgi:hypothetical protein